MLLHCAHPLSDPVIMLIECIATQMSMAIGEENKLQKQAAETLSDYLEQADVALRRGMRRVNKALRQSKSNHLLYLRCSAWECSSCSTSSFGRIS